MPKLLHMVLASIVTVLVCRTNVLLFHSANATKTQLLQIHANCPSTSLFSCICDFVPLFGGRRALPRLVMAFIATYSYPTNCAQTFYHLLCIANSLDLSMLCRVNSSNIGCCHFKRTPFIGCHRVAARVQIHIKLVNLQKRRRLSRPI